MFEFSSKVDTSGFDSVFDDYLKWSKKQPAEIVNAKLYFIALNAMQTTKKADAGQIKAQLNAPSQKYPNKTLGEVLTLMDLRKRGKMPKRGKTLAKNMAAYVEKFENKRVSRINFLRSGWLPAIKKLDFWNRKGDITFTRKFAPKRNLEVKQYGKDKGNVMPARLEGETVKGTISNDVGRGKQATRTVHDILQHGLDRAVLREINSMRIYIEKKFQAQHDKMRRKREAGITTH